MNNRIFFWWRSSVLLIVDSLILLSTTCICHWRPKTQNVLLGEIYCTYVVDFMSFLHCIWKVHAFVGWIVWFFKSLLWTHLSCLCEANISSCRLSKLESGIPWLDTLHLQVFGRAKNTHSSQNCLIFALLISLCFHIKILSQISFTSSNILMVYSPKISEIFLHFLP